MLKRGRPRTQRGINLVELMVGIAISLILLAGVISVMLRVSVAGGESVQAARLNQQLRGAMEQITRDLQRAGYVNAFDGDDINLRAVRLFGFADISPDGNCILYSYDRNGDGMQGVGVGGTLVAGEPQNQANFEIFGFRVNNGVLQTLTAGGRSCTSGTWTAISDARITISAPPNRPVFSINYVVPTPSVTGDATVYEFRPEADSDLMGDDLESCIAGITADEIDADGNVLQRGEKCLARRKVEVALAGSLVGDPSVTLVLRNDVKIKNDHYISCESTPGSVMTTAECTWRP